MPTRTLVFRFRKTAWMSHRRAGARYGGGGEADCSDSRWTPVCRAEFDPRERLLQSFSARLRRSAAAQKTEKDSSRTALVAVDLWCHPPRPGPRRREANRAVFPWAPSRSRPCKACDLGWTTSKDHTGLDSELARSSPHLLTGLTSALTETLEEPSETTGPPGTVQEKPTEVPTLKPAPSPRKAPCALAQSTRRSLPTPWRRGSTQELSPSRRSSQGRAPSKSSRSPSKSSRSPSKSSPQRGSLSSSSMLASRDGQETSDLGRSSTFGHSLSLKDQLATPTAKPGIKEEPKQIEMEPELDHMVNRGDSPMQIDDSALEVHDQDQPYTLDLVV
eukprot:s2579_g1.t2